ncbi:MAG: acetate kinase [Oscillospiraceae bacterium]|nr:acetate kinase [Oscillospiraceae bacterium]
MKNEQLLAKGVCERIGLDGKLTASTSDGRRLEREVAMSSHTEAFLQVKLALTEGECKIIESLKEIEAVGHRIVHGGTMFTQSVLIDEGVIDVIKGLCDLAPLHNPAGIQGIRACIGVFGSTVPQVAVFDNAFHTSMPPESYMFALPYEYYEKYGIRRYGFHGTSHRFVSQRCTELMDKPLEDFKLITCHLGNGSSIAAIKDGKVLDTSMGLTPLDGFMMGTRTGAVDPSAVLYLMEKEGWSPKETADIMNKKSGCFGISGVSSDDRDIKAAAENGNERAKLARKMLAYQIRKFIGSYAAAMNGVDAIVFTGGIGENTHDLRQSVCENISFLGLELDCAKNDELRFGKEGEVTTDTSRVKVFIIPTNEELLIARDTLKVAQGQ